MQLLKYEFMQAPEGSYNGMLGELVQQVRYCRTVPGDQIGNLSSGLQTLQATLQSIDEDLMQPERHYIDEIMAELEREDEIEEKLLEEVARSINVMSKALLKKEVLLSEFSFNYINQEGVYWLTLNSFTDERDADASLIIAKECFRSVCGKYGVVFFDCIS